MYLQEGNLAFLKDITTLKKETNESKLGKAIARVMHAGQKQPLWVEEALTIKK
jgi:hypothetical protein